MIKDAKKFPCEECRNQKRKCNGNQPCQRCHKVGLRCDYIKILDPGDEIYVQQAQENEALKDIANMNGELEIMEKELVALKRTAAYCATEGPLILQDGLKATVTQQSNQSWSLTVSKDGLSIRTNVKTYVDLMIHLQQSFASLRLQGFVPPKVWKPAQTNALIDYLASVVRKKYCKNQFWSTKRSYRLLMLSADQKDIEPISTGNGSLTIITLELFRAYLQCQHYRQMAFHRPTFYTLFIEPGPVIDSPAVMAVCAAICSDPMSCKHVSRILPREYRREYGKYYFERARELLADRFDEPCLETLTGFIFMAKYKMALLCTKEAAFYASMAERFAQILRSTYSSDKSGRGILFGRLLKQLNTIRAFYKSLNAETENSHYDYAAIFVPDEDDWVEAPDDSALEKRFLQLHSYRLQLQKMNYGLSSTAQSCANVAEMLVIVARRAEMSMQQWHNELPKEFKLSSPVFDASMSDLEFFRILEEECATDVIPALNTLQLYDEYLILGRSLLPKNMVSRHSDIENLIRSWNLDYQNAGHEDTMLDIPPKVLEKWERRVQKLRKLKKAINFQGSDKAYLDVISNTFVAEEHRSVTFAYVIDAAINSVRILQFLRSRSSDCFFEMRTLMDTWRLLLQICNIGSHLPLGILSRMPQVKTYLILCMDIIREECHHLNGLSSESFDSMEKETLDLLAKLTLMSLCHSV